MTNEEAIKIRSAFNNGFEYPFGDGDIHACNIGEVNRHAKLLDEALEKQIPKKLLPEKSYYGNGKCPSCNAVFLDKSTKYCGNCGQALDWSDYE